MERSEIVEAMGGLKLFGMRGAPMTRSSPPP
jgi:hypothetical protein